MLAFGCSPISRHRQRNRNLLTQTLDLAIDVEGEFAGAELGEMHAIASAQSTNVSLVIRPPRD